MLAALATDAGGADAVAALLHEVVDDLCGRPLRTFSHLRAKATVTAAGEFFRDAVGSGWDEAEARAALSEAGAGEAETAAALTVLEARRSEVEEALVRQLLTISSAHLKDFDWSLRLILCSDRLSGMRKPVLALRLYVTQKDGSKREVTLEMGKSELDSLLEQCSAAQDVVQRLTLS